jgi:ABC-type transport system involved in cytochrome c biogenesis permease subunit
MGYAGCCLAGLIGHFYLLQAIIQPRQEARLRSLYNALYAVLGFGLTFSFLGTMLGGVWADQSWGRFWGWDPKENGALLIVLWCAILFHARIARMIGNIGMAAGSILGIIVVLFAWLGVNLLGVGLHSYGFTSGVATGLFAYSVGQVVFLAVVVPWARRRRASAVEASASIEA